MGSEKINEAMEKILKEFAASNARLEEVFRECYAVKPSWGYPSGYKADAETARGCLRHGMIPLGALKRAIEVIALELPEDTPSEVENGVEQLYVGLRPLLAFFEKKAEAELRR